MDRNIDFGRTRGLLQFVLRMLGLCAAPNERDFPYLHEKSSSKWRECSYNLGHLPPSLRAPWLRVFFVILYKVHVHLRLLQEGAGIRHSVFSRRAFCNHNTEIILMVKHFSRTCTCRTLLQVFCNSFHSTVSCMYCLITVHSGVFRDRPELDIPPLSLVHGDDSQDDPGGVSPVCPPHPRLPPLLGS